MYIVFIYLSRVRHEQTDAAHPQTTPQTLAPPPAPRHAQAAQDAATSQRLRSRGPSRVLRASRMYMERRNERRKEETRRGGGEGEEENERRKGERIPSGVLPSVSFSERQFTVFFCSSRTVQLNERVSLDRECERMRRAEREERGNKEKSVTYFASPLSEASCNGVHPFASCIFMLVLLFLPLPCFSFLSFHLRYNTFKFGTALCISNKTRTEAFSAKIASCTGVLCSYCKIVNTFDLTN